MYILGTEAPFNLLLEDNYYQKIIIDHRYLPEEPPVYGSLDISEPLKKALEKRGIQRLYSHQVEALKLIREGKNVVIMTPTASGKSLIYNIPIIESILKDPSSTALMIFPLKGLEQNQLEVLNELLRDSGLTDLYVSKRGSIVKRAEVYDGDISDYRRRSIRLHRPSVILTNPDMIHLAINAYHRKWSDFLSHLKYIVIDELHAYRGVFGSHVSHVLRRLKRMASFYGSSPQFIACSATIANPLELAETLTGESFVVIDKSGAPRSARHYFLINPLESPYTEATRLFIYLVKAGLRTIAFTKARKISELIYRWVIEREPALKDKISAYRAGFLPRERRSIEERLFKGDLLGVISTSALELGIDIGGLDACILVGYPGSISSFYQRAGRVGRGGQESAVFFIALRDGLDQYFMRHPEEFFNKGFEAVVIDPSNTYILKDHILIAGAELSFIEVDGKIKNYDLNNLERERFYNLLKELLNENLMKRSKRNRIYSINRFPHKNISIRSSGTVYRIRLSTGEPIGEIDEWRLLKECHPEAIYLHRGKQYRVLRILYSDKEVLVTEVDVLYYTNPLISEKIEIIERRYSSDLENLKIRWGIIDIMQKIVGYEKKNIFDGVTISRHLLDMPERRFRTEGLWMVLGEIKELIEGGFDLAGSLHAMEHVLISCVPLFAISEKGDIGGLSYPELFIEGERRPVIFIYDACPGGAGLTKRLLENTERWFRTALSIISECPCHEGCPSCVQDPQCGSSNTPLDKYGAGAILKTLIKE